MKEAVSIEGGVVEYHGRTNDASRGFALGWK